MADEIKLTEKYEFNGWPSLARPDVKPPAGWNLELLTAVNLLGGHTLSPDGERLAFTWMRDELTEVYVMPTLGGWPQRVSHGRKLSWPGEVAHWSPDGRWLAFEMNSHVYTTPTTGGLPRKISDFASGAGSPVWMPDSRGLIVTVEREDSEQLLLTDRDGRWPRPLVTRTDGDCWEARPSPDGRLVCVRPAWAVTKECKSPVGVDPTNH